jgi:hypothetical protein
MVSNRSDPILSPTIRRAFNSHGSASAEQEAICTRAGMPVEIDAGAAQRLKKAAPAPSQFKAEDAVKPGRLTEPAAGALLTAAQVRPARIIRQFLASSAIP